MARGLIAKLEPSEAQGVLRAWPRGARLLEGGSSDSGSKRDEAELRVHVDARLARRSLRKRPVRLAWSGDRQGRRTTDPSVGRFSEAGPEEKMSKVRVERR